MPHSLTLAAVYHSEVLCLPFLPNIREQAKPSMVSTLELSNDPQVRECLCLLKDPQFTNRMDIPSSACSILEATKSSLEATFKLHESQTCHQTVVEKISH